MNRRLLMRALDPRRGALPSALLLGMGAVIALGGALYGYIEGRRTERVLVAARPIVAGQALQAADLTTVELPRYRPAQFAGITDPAQVIGRWAARSIEPDDLLKPVLLRDHPPDQPVFPNGVSVAPEMIPAPFSTETIGPLTHYDRVNIGFNDPSGQAQRCRVEPPAQAPPTGPYACRLFQHLRVLYIDDTRQLAYLELTPDQAQMLWAIQAAGLKLWGERYGAGSRSLVVPSRVEAGIPLQHDDRVSP